MFDSLYRIQVEVAFESFLPPVDSLFFDVLLVEELDELVSAAAAFL